MTRTECEDIIHQKMLEIKAATDEYLGRETEYLALSIGACEHISISNRYFSQEADKPIDRWWSISGTHTCTPEANDEPI